MTQLYNFCLAKVPSLGFDLILINLLFFYKLVTFQKQLIKIISRDIYSNVKRGRETIFLLFLS